MLQNHQPQTHKPQNPPTQLLTNLPTHPPIDKADMLKGSG